MENKEIKDLDGRQCIYIPEGYHLEQYGTDQLIINGQSYDERCQQHHPDKNNIMKIRQLHPHHRAYLWCNRRGWTVVFRTEKNEDMFEWKLLEEIQMEE